uniref:Predicted protein n=1 Tax=Hordeum vulgare subsp. vulgare TaxID=112509 RepID=F2DYS5_HORVV|nr:predicted protein [Hordeum vulgare subsp. vulgare]
MPGRLAVTRTPATLPPVHTTSLNDLIYQSIHTAMASV